jgi:hypothetical protein
MDGGRRPLSIPEPGGMAISPGRRLFRPLTRCHRPWPGCQAPDQPTKPAGTVWVRPATRRATRRRTLHRGAPDRPVVSCAARVGLARPTKQVVDSPLGAVLAAGWHSNGLCEDLEQHIHDGNGNQVEFLTRYTPARWSSGRPRPCGNSAGWNVAPRSLTLPPCLVPTTLAALRGGVDPGSSCRPARS